MNPYDGTAREYLLVHYYEKDEAKALGAMWDASVKKWFVPHFLPKQCPHAAAELRRIWTPGPEAQARYDNAPEIARAKREREAKGKFPIGCAPSPGCSSEAVQPFKRPRVASVNHLVSRAPREYLSVPHAEKDEAKALGAMWDAYMWYIPEFLPNDRPHDAAALRQRWGKARNTGTQMKLGCADEPIEKSSSSLKPRPQDEIRHQYKCPITLQVMKDPVLASDGHTYERKAIQEWIEKQQTEGEDVTSPLTREVLTPDRLIPNHFAKSCIQNDTRLP